MKGLKDKRICWRGSGEKQKQEAQKENLYRPTGFYKAVSNFCSGKVLDHEEIQKKTVKTAEIHEK